MKPDDIKKRRIFGGALALLAFGILCIPTLAHAQIAATQNDASPAAEAGAEAQNQQEQQRSEPELPGADIKLNSPDPSKDGIVVPYNPPEPVDMTHIYSPEYCEFKVGFPTEPFITEKCDGGENADQCYEEVSYTQTFGMDATVGFRVVCNAIGDDIKDRYSQDIMIATLVEMTKKSVVNTFNTTYFQDKENRYRLAGLVGEGKVGITPSMFIAQMWLGQNSALTIEAELIGDAFENSDALFRDVLRSVRYKDNAPGDSASTPADSETTNSEEPAESAPE